MTELTDDAQLQDGSDEAGQEASPGVDLGADLFAEPDTDDTDSGGNASAQSDTQQARTYTPDELRQANPDDLPPEWRTAQTFMRQFQGSTDQRMAQMENELTTLRQGQQAQTQPEAVATAVTQALQKQQGGDDPYAELRSRLPEEDQGSIDVVDRMLELKYGPQLEELAAFRQQSTQAFQALVGLMQRQAQGTLTQEVTDLRNDYGDNFSTFYDANKTQIDQMRQMSNPRTGSPFTLREAYEMLSGVDVTQRVSAKANERNAINDAKRRAAAPMTGDSNGGTGELSEAELLSLAEALPGIGPRSY